MPGQLFGVSLPNICENDNLPKPVLVSLVLACDTNGKGEPWEGNLFWNGKIIDTALALTENIIITSKGKNLIKLLPNPKGDIMGEIM